VNQNQKQTPIHPAHVAELNSSDVNIEESEVMTLNYYKYGDEIAETIEMLVMTETCIINPDLAGCNRMPHVIRVSISPRRDFVTLRFGESDKRITYRRDGKIVVRTGNAVLLADSRFVLFKYRRDGSLVPQAKSARLTWHGTEEIYDTRAIREVIRNTITTILDVARDVLQS